MPDTYLMETLEPDAAAIVANSIGRLRGLLSDYDPDRDPMGVLLIQAVAEQQVPLVEVVSDSLSTIFAHVAEVAGHDRIMPSPAAGLVTITTDGAQARELPAGATLRGSMPDGTLVVFATTTDVTVPFDEMNTGDVITPDVPVEAIYDGLAVGITVPQPLEPDQAYTWLTAVTLTSLTAPGADGEDDDEYMDRASSAMRDQADMLILPENVQRFVERIPGVGRALVLDRVNAADPAVPLSPRAACMTVIITGPDGSAAGGPDGTDVSGLITDVRALLAARREVDFEFFVWGATYVPLEIELTVAAWSDSLDTVADRVEAALRGWLHPSTFAARGLGYGDGSWAPTSTVRIGEVVSVADSVEGVDYVSPALVEIGGVNADMVLSAPLAALPDPANLTITVNVVEREP